LQAGVPIHAVCSLRENARGSCVSHTASFGVYSSDCYNGRAETSNQKRKKCEELEIAKAKESNFYETGNLDGEASDDDFGDGKIREFSSSLEPRVVSANFISSY